jgi:hypothetical protein
MLDMSITSTQMIIGLVWVGMLAVAWLVLMYGRDSDDRRPPVVGVQRHGRTYFVRKDTLDRIDTPGQENCGSDSSWTGGTHRFATRRGKRVEHRRRVIDTVVLTALASVIAGIVLFGQ